MLDDRDVTKYLADHGFKTTETTARKRVRGFADPGTISDGTRILQLQWCPRFRYLSIVNGWGEVECDVDKRDFMHPRGLVTALLVKQLFNLKRENPLQIAEKALS